MRLEGQGLHTAARGAVILSRRAGPVVLRARGEGERRRDELAVVGTTRSTAVATLDGGLRLGTVEHLFAALGGMSIHAGVAIEVEGGELPLLDGGASAFVEALRGLGVPRSAPSLRVVTEAVLEVGSSRYELSPGEGVDLEVEIDFGDLRLAPRARWQGDADDFAARIAPARTFGFEREVSELLARGLAGHVSPESVIVIGDDRVLAAGAPFTSDEPARHKLLDLVGDLWIHGGPPRGRVRAVRPGHAATHEVVRRALASGAMVREAPSEVAHEVTSV